MTTTESPPRTTITVDPDDVREHKPPLTQTNILVMTLGFFGNSFGFRDRVFSGQPAC
jgi:hypothetical protein